MLLKDHFQDAVVGNESGKQWSSCYQGVVSKVINDNQYKKIAEVGIGYGTHAKQILRNTECDILYLIDPMKQYENDAFAQNILKCTPISENNNFDEFANLIKDQLQEYQNRFQWFRKGSLEVTNLEIPDESLDLVFIDGDHSQDAVLKDLHFWFPKVRQGGQILGDDYWMDSVSNAVHRFALEKNLSVDFLTKHDSNQKIYRFHKN